MLYSSFFFRVSKKVTYRWLQRKYIRNGARRKCLKNFLRLYGDSCKKNSSVKNSAWVRRFSQIYCQRKLWLYFFFWPGKENKYKKQLYNLGCYKTMKLEVGGLATKNRFVHCLQQIVHYFKKREVDIFLNLIPCYSNKLTKKTISKNYWLIYWSIKMLFNTISWRLFSKLLHVRIFSLIETRKW